MSYSRFSHADVYVYMDINGTLACCGCSLYPDEPWYYDSTEAMIEHLAEHRAAYHDVPPGIEDSLRADDADNFPATCRNGHSWGEPFQPYPDRFPRLQRVRCVDCDWQTSWPRTEAPTRAVAR